MAARIILITGANSGIGFQIAKALFSAPEPFQIIMAGRSLSKIEAAISDLGSSKDLTPLQLDVTDQISIKNAASQVKQQFGKLDALINNAGIAPEGPDLATVFQTTFATNVFGPALVSAAFRDLLLKSESPYSVYVSSRVGSLSMMAALDSPMRHTRGGTAAYRASKSALNMVMLHEQVEVEGTNIKVMAMCPGFVVSNLRGPSEEQRTAGGRAGNPEVSALLALSILRGERDADSQKIIAADATYGW